MRYHLSLAQIEQHLAEIAPGRLILTHMSDDMLASLAETGFEAAEDGMAVRL